MPTPSLIYTDKCEKFTNNLDDCDNHYVYNDMYKSNFKCSIIPNLHNEMVCEESQTIYNPTNS